MLCPVIDNNPWNSTVIGRNVLKMKVPLHLAAVLLLVISGTFAQQRVAFCDLVRNPAKYNGQEVTIRATYRYGYEWSQLYCLDCLDTDKAWVEIPVDLDDASLRAFKQMPKGADIVNVTVTGMFYSGSTYGHLNGYRYKVVATKLSDVAVIVKGMKNTEKEIAAEKSRACGGTNPK